MTVRDAQPGDERAIAATRVRGWQTAYRGVVGDEHLDAMSVDADATRWATLLAEQDRYSRTLVVEDDGGVVVGFCSIGPDRTVDRDAAYAVTALAVPGTVGEVYALYVDPGHWGTGVSDELMRAALTSLRHDGWVRANLWLLAQNPRARRFYERHGWVADGGRQTLTLPGDPVEIRMTRPLP
jgi:GNAT superfamily N-acetyltransferase